jgi:uncharacterized repeat protein (TIGR01451 family)
MQRYNIIAVLLTFLVVAAGMIHPADARQPERFTPVINKMGYVQEDEFGTYVEWAISVSNIGQEAGQNPVITDVLPDSLQIDDVRINTGTTSINDQTVRVSLEELAPGDTVQFTLITTPLGEPGVSNTACISAENLTQRRCATSTPVQMLPSTGETPPWRRTLMMLGLAALSMSLFMFGLAGAGLRAVFRH